MLNHREVNILIEVLIANKAIDDALKYGIIGKLTLIMQLEQL
tara:strand:+ start:945 stop:1070 length:126 start_codon:yes stop_codon:yes gene_type:complete